MPETRMNQPEAAAFRSELKRHMKHRGLTQATLADKIGQSPGYVRKILALAQPPAPAVARRIAEELGIPAAEREAFARRFRRVDELRLSPPALPAVRTASFGTEAVLTAILALLVPPHRRLLTLVGPGGAGKTRLALQAARLAQPSYPDGTWFVDLAPVRDPGQVAPAIATGLGLAEAADLPRYLRDRRLLLVLDNFEHVEGAAPAVGALLDAAPGLHILVTSRVPLRLYGEHLFRVPPLALPSLATTDLAALAAAPAVQLFVDRAQAVWPEFALTAETAPLVMAICTRLDGLPLPIILAAERVKHYAPLAAPQQLAAILADLATPLELLTYGRRDRPPRQQTLRALLDWSYDLLPALEQRLFTRLAVFADDCSLAAAEVVCQATADDLHRLTLAGLVQIGPARGESRYTMLFTVRAYAQHRLAASGEAAAMQATHAHYYLEQAAQAARGLPGPGAVAWLAWLEIEHANLWAALHWARNDGPPAVATTLAQALLAQAAQPACLDHAARLFAESQRLAAAGADALAAAGALAGLEAVALSVGRQEIAEQFAAARHALGAVCALPPPDRPGLAAAAAPPETIGILEASLAFLLEPPALHPARARAIRLAQQGWMAGAGGDFGRALHRLQTARVLFHALDDRIAEAAVAQRIAETQLHD